MSKSTQKISPIERLVEQVKKDKEQAVTKERKEILSVVKQGPKNFENVSKEIREYNKFLMEQINAVF
jgi:predicted transcriptional regulator